MPATQVVLDANGLMAPFQFRFNLDVELGRLLGAYDLVVPRSVVQELEGLAKSHRTARAALKLLNRCRIVDSEGRGDEAVVEVAHRLRGVVLTNDRPLIQALRTEGIPVLRVLHRGHLGYEGAPR